MEIKYFTTTRACSCPDWQYRGRYRPCKHIKALVAAYALIQAQNVKNTTLRIDNRQAVGGHNEH